MHSATIRRFAARSPHHDANRSRAPPPVVDDEEAVRYPRFGTFSILGDTPLSRPQRSILAAFALFALACPAVRAQGTPFLPLPPVPQPPNLVNLTAAEQLGK